MPETFSILHVETGRHRYGGAQQVLWLVEALGERGVDSTLVCSAGSAVAASARDAGLEVVELPCGGDLDWRFGRRLYRLLAERRPDIVHCHSRRGADWHGGRAARRAGIPAVVSRRVDNREPAWLARLRYRPFARIVAISQAIATALEADGVEPGRIDVIRSAVDAERFAPTADCAEFRRRHDLADGDRVVFCVAQFIERKGHRHLFDAAGRLVPRYPALKILLFGRGPLEQELRAEVDRRGLGRVVHFAGFSNELAKYLGCADLLVHPALGEGLGVAALEAAAAGLPVVAFAAGGLTEAVVDGETGRLVAPGDAGALAEAMAALLDDPARCRQLGARGRARMLEDFSVAAMADAHLALYRKLR